MIGMAAAAAVAFCTPTPGVAVEPAVVVEGFEAAFAGGDLAGMQHYLRSDATITLSDQQPRPAAEWFPDVIPSPAGPPPTKTRIYVRNRVIVVTPAVRLQPRGNPGPVYHSDGASSVTEYEIEAGCIVHFSMQPGWQG